MNYQKANDLLQGRCKNSRKLANNTYLQRRDNGEIAVLLHNTDIVTFKPNGVTVLNSGGWRTPTTKARINDYSPAHIYQSGGVWYMGRYNAESPLFEDGIEIGSDGLPLNPVFNDQQKDKKRRALLRKIKAYAKLCADSCPIPEPSGGDCWGCYFVSEDGQSAMGTDHLLSHFDESYVVPSLVYRACKRYGISPIAGAYLTGQQNIGSFDQVAKKQIEKAVYRFIKNEFGIAA